MWSPKMAHFGGGGTGNIESKDRGLKDREKYQVDCVCLAMLFKIKEQIRKLDKIYKT